MAADDEENWEIDMQKVEDDRREAVEKMREWDKGSSGMLRRTGRPNSMAQMMPVFLVLPPLPILK